MSDDALVATAGHSQQDPKPGDRGLRARDPWVVAAVVCLFGGAVLLVVAWYDISGTANVYEQLPYLVSAGFSGLALIIVGSALLAAGRADRIERRLAQLVDALTEAASGDHAGRTGRMPMDAASPAPESLPRCRGRWRPITARAACCFATSRRRP